MRRRLLVATVGTVTVGVLLLGLPLAVAIRGVLTQQALDRLQSNTEQVQTIINAEPMTLPQVRAQLTQLAEQSDVRFRLANRQDTGVVVIDTGGQPEVPDDFEEDLRRVSEGEIGRATGDGFLAVAVPLRVGGVTQVLRAFQDDTELKAELSGALVSIAGLGVTSLGLAGLVGLMVARRLAAPMEDLAAAATQLGEGDFTARAPRSGIPESDQVATALDITADRLGMLVERSRSFGADASHQLRTPLTALRLDLEALELSGADPALLQAAFTEADRLEKTIEELLALADAPLGDEYLKVGQLATARLASWEALAEADGRAVELEVAEVPLVRARSAAIGQCLQVLLDNALEHGQGTITVSVSAMEAAALGGRGWVRLCVQDEGPGFATDSTPGRGLKLARSLIQAEGGRMKVEPDATVCLLMPAAAQDPSSAVPAAPAPVVGGEQVSPHV